MREMERGRKPGQMWTNLSRAKKRCLSGLWQGEDDGPLERIGGGLARAGEIFLDWGI